MRRIVADAEARSRRRRQIELGGNALLMAFGVAALFVAPLLPEAWAPRAYSACVTGILLAAVMALRDHRRRILVVAIAVAIIENTAGFLGNASFVAGSRALNVLFYAYVVFALIRTVATTRQVSLLVIAQAMNGYLLLGLLFGFLVIILGRIDPAAYSFSTDGIKPGDAVYHAFVTFTTVGYGDLVPLSRQARALAMLTGFSGQIYVAVVIAMLVGKFASTNRPE